MRLSKGQEVYAVIKASNVMVAIDWRQVFASSTRDCRFEKAAVVRQNQAELIQNHYRTAFQIFRLPNQRGADVSYFTFWITGDLISHRDSFKKIINYKVQCCCLILISGHPILLPLI
jgi:hypothetical protein